MAQEPHRTEECSDSDSNSSNSQEETNNSKHIHIYLKLKNRIDTRDPRFADVLGFHGNYQGCRSARNVARYCAKGDNYIANFDVAGYLQGINKKRKIGQFLISKEKTLMEVVEEFPEMLMGYKKLKLDIAAYELDAHRPPVIEKICTWYYGETGMGKTWWAMHKMGFDL